MCQLGREITELEATKENPIVGIRFWKVNKYDDNIRGLNNQFWSGKNCSGNISQVMDNIPLGVYSYKNYKDYSNYIYNYYYYYIYNYNYYYYYIFGEVSLWGKIKQHEIGYRAEQAEVKTLFLLDDVKGRDKDFLTKFNKKIIDICSKYDIAYMTEYEYLAL